MWNHSGLVEEQAHPVCQYVLVFTGHLSRHIFNCDATWKVDLFSILCASPQKNIRDIFVSYLAFLLVFRYSYFLKLSAAAKSLQSCLTLCDPIDGSPLSTAIPGILQARTQVCCHFLLQCMKVKSEVAQSCLTLSNPVDCSPPGSSIHEIFQARVLEWVAIAF